MEVTLQAWQDAQKKLLAVEEEVQPLRSVLWHRAKAFYLYCLKEWKSTNVQFMNCDIEYSEFVIECFWGGETDHEHFPITLLFTDNLELTAKEYVRLRDEERERQKKQDERVRELQAKIERKALYDRLKQEFER